jgi:type I restriction enzyme S subunit
MTTANGWPPVSLAQLLTNISREERVEPDREYELLGARWYAKGLYTKEVKSGSQIRAPKLYRVHAGDFVYNRLFAWKGSFAVASIENDGCFVSNEFPCFAVNRDQLIPEFLWYYFGREESWNRAFGLSTGATPTSRNRLKEALLLAMTVPLPPLEEQQRIVMKIDHLAAKISEAQVLRRRSNDECDQLCRAILRDDRWGAPTPTPMHELVTWRKPHVSVVAAESYDFAGVYCFGRGVFRGQRKTGMDFAYKQLTQLHAGEFVYPKLMAWEGALGVVPQECDGFYVSPEFPVFTINEDRVLPEVLDVYFRSPAVWPLLSGASTGTNVRRKRLNPNDFLKYEFPLPPRQAQMALRAARGRMSELQPLQNQAAQLEAMLPSVLDRAFKGEL